MLTLQRTDTHDANFQNLVKELDNDLAQRNGEANAFFVPFNALTHIQTVIVAYVDNEPIGCGAIKAFDAERMEVKRMYVVPKYRGHGYASAILAALEQWTLELGYSSCVLETGDKMPEAIAVYNKSGYHIIPNYGPYKDIESSICFEKML